MCDAASGLVSQTCTCFLGLEHPLISQEQELQKYMLSMLAVPGGGGGGCPAYGGRLFYVVGPPKAHAQLAGINSSDGREHEKRPRWEHSRWWARFGMG